jgi:hypothetical protein
MVATMVTAAAGLTSLRERSDIPVTLPAGMGPPDAAPDLPDFSLIHIRSIRFS